MSVSPCQTKCIGFLETFTNDGIVSSFMCLQLFSDKLQTSSSAGALQFFFLLIALLSFSENCRRALIAFGKTVVAYLLVSFNSNSLGHGGKHLSETGLVYFRRTESMKGLHECLEHCLEPLTNAALDGLTMTTRALQKIQFHFYFHRMRWAYLN